MSRVSSAAVLTVRSHRTRLLGCLALVLCAGSALACSKEAPTESTAKPASPASPTGAAVSVVATVVPPSPAPSTKAQPDESPTPPLYAVFDVKADDVLNVRAEPDGKSAKVYSFGPSVKRVEATGRTETKGNVPWMEVAFEGGTGWVNRRYLTEVKKGDGCADPELTALIRAFMRAVVTKDESTLAELISPVHGLMVRHRPSETTALYRGDEVDGLFTGGTTKYFGLAAGSGAKVQGTFKSLVLPTLIKSIEPGSQEKCGKLLTGAGGAFEWPSEYGPLTVVSFYWPGRGGNDWHSWVGGIEYVDRKPYFAVLVGYRAGA